MDRTCINCKHFEPASTRCALEGWPKNNDDTCGKFSACDDCACESKKEQCGGDCGCSASEKGPCACQELTINTKHPLGSDYYDRLVKEIDDMLRRLP